MHEANRKGAASELTREMRPMFSRQKPRHVG